MNPLTRTAALIHLAVLALAPDARAQTIDDLSFMAGCYRGTAPDGSGSTIDERFSSPRAGMMLGATQYVEQGRTVFFELHRIEEKDGKVVMWPQPGGKAPTVGFTLVSVKDAVATFENLSHDFPRRIVYRRTADGLASHVEGEEGGKAHAEDTSMSRIPCEEPASGKDTKSSTP